MDCWAFGWRFNPDFLLISASRTLGYILLSFWNWFCKASNQGSCFFLDNLLLDNVCVVVGGEILFPVKVRSYLWLFNLVMKPGVVQWHWQWIRWCSFICLLNSFYPLSLTTLWKRRKNIKINGFGRKFGCRSFWMVSLFYIL